MCLLEVFYVAYFILINGFTLFFNFWFVEALLVFMAIGQSRRESSLQAETVRIYQLKPSGFTSQNRIYQLKPVECYL
jgi:hypothetical protein